MSVDRVRVVWEGAGPLGIRWTRAGGAISVQSIRPPSTSPAISRQGLRTGLVLAQMEAGVLGVDGYVRRGFSGESLTEVTEAIRAAPRPLALVFHNSPDPVPGAAVGITTTARERGRMVDDTCDLMGPATTALDSLRAELVAQQLSAAATLAAAQESIASMKQTMEEAARREGAAHDACTACKAMLIEEREISAAAAQALRIETATHMDAQAENHRQAVSATSKELAAAAAEHERQLAALKLRIQGEAAQRDLAQAELGETTRREQAVREAHRRTKQEQQEHLATVAADAQEAAESLVESHRAELGAVQMKSEVELQELTRAHALEQQLMRQELAALRAAHEAGTHETLTAHAQALEEARAIHAAVEAQSVEEHTARLERVRATHARSLEATESAASATADEHAKAVALLAEDVSVARAEAAQLRIELQEERSRAAANLAQASTVTAAATADIAESAAAHYVTDLAAQKIAIEQKAEAALAAQEKASSAEHEAALIASASQLQTVRAQSEAALAAANLKHRQALAEIDRSASALAAEADSKRQQLTAENFDLQEKLRNFVNSVLEELVLLEKDTKAQQQLSATRPDTAEEQQHGKTLRTNWLALSENSVGAYHELLLEYKEKRRSGRRASSLWIADVQAAMSRSIAAMESHAAQVANDHAKALASAQQTAQQEQRVLKNRVTELNSHLEAVRKEQALSDSQRLQLQKQVESKWQRQVDQWEERAARALGLVESFRTEKAKMVEVHQRQLSAAQVGSERAKHLLEVSNARLVEHEVEHISDQICSQAAGWTLEQRSQARFEASKAALTQAILDADLKTAEMKSQHTGTLKATVIS
jgi:hypothetical protein